MFSRRERDFLELIRTGDRASADRRLEAAFPNPVYRHKLLWAIRRKADRSVADWDLLREAASRDIRLLITSDLPTASPPPVFADPLVTFLRRLGRRLPRRRTAAREAVPPPSRGER